jgi:hypothetical protein
MRSRTILVLLAIALTLLQAGCAADFHAGGYREGVSAGVAVTPGR